MKYVIWAMLAIITAASAPALAIERKPPLETVSVEIVSGSGKIFHTIPHDDFWRDGTHVYRRYLAALRGEKYGIVIRNKSSDRIGVVIAVDGRNIISGRQSNLENSENMYILNSWETAEYKGWRTSNDQIHRFYFTNETDSYAVKTFADSSAMGVIAVAVYPEHHELKRQSAKKFEAPAKKSNDRATANESAGTGFGEGQYSPVLTVDFNPERVPIQTTLLKYEWQDTLCKKGMMICDQKLGNRFWDGQYAPYPPGYQND